MKIRRASSSEVMTFVWDLNDGKEVGLCRSAGQGGSVSGQGKSRCKHTATGIGLDFRGAERPA